MKSAPAVAALIGFALLGLSVRAASPRASAPAGPTPQAAAPPAPPRLPRSYVVELEGAAQAPAHARRTASVHLLPIVGRDQRVDVVYDAAAVLRPTTLDALRTAPEWEVGVRLLLGEMGAWRLRDSRWSLLEGVGILETVANRFEPDLSNPLRIDGVRAWQGCGRGGTFASCVHPEQYLGLDSGRALRPRDTTAQEATLLAGVDRAVAAWFVFEEALLGEITAGATSFVHLCGGQAYGRSTRDCEGPGADPSRGPIVFRGPSAWLPDKGRYALEVLGAVDFEAAPPPEAEHAYRTYLLGHDAAVYAAEAARQGEGR